MAYVDQTQNDPNNPQTQQPGTAGQAPQTSTGTGGSVSAPVTRASGQGAASQPVQSKAPAFQDLGAYLTANAPQIQQMGQNVAQNITNQGTAAKTAVDNAQNAFNTAVQNNTTSLDQGLLSAALANPAQFTSNPQNVSNFQKQYNANYGGPTDFTQQPGFNDLNAKVQGAVQTAQNVSTPEGIGQLITGQEKNPTAGIRTLDTMLLGQNPDAVAAVKAAAQPYTSLNDYLGNVVQTANQGAAQAAATTAATNAAAHDQAAQAVQAWEQGLQGRQAQGEAQRQAYNTQLLGLQNQLSPADQMLRSFASQTGININNPLSALYAMAPQNAAATLGNVASAEDYAKDQALATLLGQSNFLNPAEANLAGTFQAPTNSLLSPEDYAYNTWASNFYGPNNPVSTAINQHTGDTAWLNNENSAQANLQELMSQLDPAHIKFNRTANGWSGNFIPK